VSRSLVGHVLLVTAVLSAHSGSRPGSRRSSWRGWRTRRRRRRRRHDPGLRKGATYRRRFRWRSPRVLQSPRPAVPSRVGRHGPLLGEPSHCGSTWT